MGAGQSFQDLLVFVLSLDLSQEQMESSVLFGKRAPQVEVLVELLLDLL